MSLLNKEEVLKFIDILVPKLKPNFDLENVVYSVSSLYFDRLTNTEISFLTEFILSGCIDSHTTKVIMSKYKTTYSNVSQVKMRLKKKKIITHNRYLNFVLVYLHEKLLKCGKIEIPNQNGKEEVLNELALMYGLNNSEKDIVRRLINKIKYEQ